MNGSDLKNVIQPSQDKLNLEGSKISSPDLHESHDPVRALKGVVLYL